MFDAPPPDSPTPEPVIALHCSGAGPGQWQPLATALGPAYELAAPTYFGSEELGRWPGAHAFTLADEAAPAMALMDRRGGKVHLVGHSYGGGVALHIAAHRPERVASLALYEPSAFHLLRVAGGAAATAFAEIVGISRQTAALVTSGDCRGAAAFFVDYWSGKGAWQALRPPVQAALTLWVAKAPLDFHALIKERTPLRAYARLAVPILLLRGEHAPVPTRAIVDILAARSPAVRLQVVAGAGHMGPITHADVVAAAIARHIADTGPASRPAVSLLPTLVGEPS